VERTLEIDLGGVRVSARLLSESAPRTSEAIAKLGTISGTARHVKWGGPAFYLQSSDANLRDLPLENKAHLLAPGVVAWVPQLGELMVAYDDARIYDGAAGGLHGTVFAEIQGDLKELGDQAYKLRSEGEKPLRVTVQEAR
jgi:hypothetical protein